MHPKGTQNAKTCKSAVFFRDFGENRKIDAKVQAFLIKFAILAFSLKNNCSFAGIHRNGRKIEKKTAFLH